MTPRSYSTELTCILLSHILISLSQVARICCLYLDEIYISLVLETFNDMLFELHQDKTFVNQLLRFLPKCGHDISICDSKIQVSSVEKLLSVTISNILCWDAHIDRSAY